MLATISRTKALEQLDIEHAAVRALINTLNDEEKTRADTIKYGLYPDQRLSFKDLLAHLITYEAFSIDALDAWQRREYHPVINDMQSSDGGRKIHYAGIENRRPQSLAQTLNEWETTQAKLMEKLRTLSDDDWNRPADFPVPVPTNVGGFLEIILVAPPRPPYRHLPVHIPDTDAYIRSLRSN